MIEIVDLRYVRMGTRDVAAATAFATEMLGLELVDRGEKCVYLRGDDRDHNICYFEGEADDHTVGFEVRDTDALARAAETLAQAGATVTQGSDAECAERRVIAFIRFDDPTGNWFDLVVRPFHSGRRCFLSRDAGITDFSHIGLRTRDAPRDEAFWTGLFNIRVNDWIGPAPLLSFDRVHHRLALFPTDRPGVQHINFQVEGVDDIMRSYYYLNERQVRIVFGPGRHPSSGARFLYFEGPDGMTFEYSWDVRMVDDTWRPRQFPFDNISFCMWGSKPDIAEFSSD
jgi:2,3-dihydroxy-p-cumate/2,3-dihydroxybenzoate 3,4-dioxygenase